jgi:hypothetical protein
MGFLRRLLSGDLRSAVAAEAAGNVDLAAERYGLAGDREGAVRMHLARAARAVDRGAEIAALRDAVHWAGDEPSLRRQAAGALGRALLAKATAEGIAVERDRERVREAAALLARRRRPPRRRRRAREDRRPDRRRRRLLGRRPGRAARAGAGA